MGVVEQYECEVCKSVQTYERVGKRRKYCGEDCAKRAAYARKKAAEESLWHEFALNCEECGKAFTHRTKTLPVRGRKYCGPACGTLASRKSCPSQNWATMTPEQRALHVERSKRARKKREAAKVAQMKADGTYRYCAHCGGDMSQRKGQIYCMEPECREAYRAYSNARTAEGMRKRYAEHKERTGESYYAKYKDRPYNKNYNYRERHPDRAKHYDHVRRARMANCESEKFLDSEIFERDGFVCGICNEPVDMEVRYPDAMSASLDHIVPLSRGGGHLRDNVRLAHLGCNNRKNARMDEEFITAS